VRDGSRGPRSSSHAVDEQIRDGVILVIFGEPGVEQASIDKDHTSVSCFGRACLFEERSGTPELAVGMASRTDHTIELLSWSVNLSSINTKSSSCTGLSMVADSAAGTECIFRSRSRS